MDIANNLTLGYLALRNGSGIVSDIIEIGTESKWSHVAMILCDPIDISSNPIEANKNSWYCFESNTDLGDNVHVIPWQDFILKESNNPIVIRPFIYENNTTMPDYERVKLIVDKYVGRPYETHVSELVLAAFRGNSSEDLGSLFCSELTALVLQELGLLEAGRIADNYVPADFSTERPNALKLIGALIGNEICI